MRSAVLVGCEGVLVKDDRTFSTKSGVTFAYMCRLKEGLRRSRDHGIEGHRRLIEPLAD